MSIRKGISTYIVEEEPEDQEIEKDVEIVAYVESGQVHYYFLKMMILYCRSGSSNSQPPD